MPNIEFNFSSDFEKIIEKRLSSAQFQLLRELFQKHMIDENQLYYIMHKRPEAIGFMPGDHVLDVGYTHLRPNQTELPVYIVSKIHLDCLTDVSIKPLSGGASRRVYHRHLVKIEK